MANISDWFAETTTTKVIFEGLYPVMVTNAKLFDKEIDEETHEKTKIVELSFKTLSDTQFPDGSADKITVKQEYRFDWDFHKNALNGIARALGLGKFQDTSEFEGKTCIIAITNKKYEKDGEQKTVAQLGYPQESSTGKVYASLFAYAPIPATGATIEYIASEIPNPTNEDYKQWFTKHLGNYKQPK